MKSDEQNEKNESTEMWADDEYQFYGQRADEHVLLVRNQHPITLLPVALITFVSLLVPYLLIRFLSGSALLYAMIAYGIIIVFYVGYHLYAYRNSVSVLSDQRIVDVHQRGFFHRQISEAELSRIQDVSTSIAGMLQTMFNFGNVTIRTASETVLTIEKIANPYDVQQAIVRALKGLQK